jgi:ABC-2 type transport system ATP-binding protein
MIRTVGLGKRFDDFVAVTGVNLTVGEGELLTLLGPNGAGKTTTVRMLTALLHPSEGEAWVAGHHIVDDAMEVRRQVGLLTEQPGVYLRMVGLDYLHFFGQLHGMPADLIQSRALDLLARFDMDGAATRRVGEYSKGMRQKLAIIRAMLHDPPVLMLDEPTSAMDPQSAKTVRDAIRQLRDDRRTILLCTHNLAEAESLADRIAIIRRGRIIAQGTPAELTLRLLGEPLMEVRLARPLDGLLTGLESLVTVEQSGPDCFRYRTTSPETVNPQVLNALNGLGADVVTLSEVPQGLESIYLQVVNGEEEVRP